MEKIAFGVEVGQAEVLRVFIFPFTVAKIWEVIRQCPLKSQEPQQGLLDKTCF